MITKGPFFVPHADNQTVEIQFPVLQRTLPSNYPYDNAYSIFPIVSPVTTENVLASKKYAGFKVDTKRPASSTTHIIATKQAISHVFNHPGTYPTRYNRDLQALSGGYGYVILYFYSLFRN